ncbi:Hypothetical_protein [Hexamita inflata]|uniref:Hypothetical_protein n=1 Tax=Hexamita inflata TaxID=28002 RepID=A0AA86V8C6_9EUKA|nr:Hypothetical protein HINF_LOCUS46833 [Hexamita inflata]
MTSPGIEPGSEQQQTVDLQNSFCAPTALQRHLILNINKYNFFSLQFLLFFIINALGQVLKQTLKPLMINDQSYLYQQYRQRHIEQLYQFDLYVSLSNSLSHQFQKQVIDSQSFQYQNFNQINVS